MRNHNNLAAEGYARIVVVFYLNKHRKVIQVSRSFSSLERKRYLHEMASREMDLLVIGGGITGAGIALDSSVRGLDVGLIEMQDFAMGTSSRSTKLIHGGLRYLKQGEIKLVQEVGREREILYRNAPHIVIPEWMLLPIIKGGTYGKWMTSFGLWVYDHLAKVRKNERRVMLNKEETLNKEPLLREDILIGSGYYVEYRTDDARLTIEVLKTAFHYGATMVNYAKADRFIYKEGKVVGVHVEDVAEGETYELYAKKVVNATGPWVDTIREMDHSKKGKFLHLTKGVHLVVDQSRFPLQQAVYFDIPDGRMMFAIPRDGKTYIGTTDTNYNGPLEDPDVTEEDISYILNGTNQMFPSLKLIREDVESFWAGLRPLIHESGKSPSELSRKDEIFVSESDLISIAGGKLTGYRKMAERVVDLVCLKLEQESQKSFPQSTTDKIKISGGNTAGYNHLEKGDSIKDDDSEFAAFKNKWVTEGESLGISSEVSCKLVNRYGSNVVKVFNKIMQNKDRAKEFNIDECLFGELVYGIEEEMVRTADDFLTRRTGNRFFDIQSALTNQEPVSRYLSTLFSK